MAPRSEDTGIGRAAFALGAVVLILVAGAAIWFAIPGPDARHKFVSPSGKGLVELGEQCSEVSCLRVAVREETEIDGGRTRRGCVFDIPERRPMLINAHPIWSPDERTLDIVYADSDGIGGRITLDLDRDCTITE